MKKPLLLMLLALFVAGAAVFFIVWLWLDYLMRSVPSMVETAMVTSLMIIAAGLCAALVFARRGPGWMYRATLVVMLLAGVAPAIIDATRTAIDERNKKAEQRAFETKYLSQLDVTRKDVASRIAAHKPFAPRKAQQFLEFVQGSDLGYRSLPDYSPQTFPLLKQALDEKILDPNARVKGPARIDVNEEPLFVVYYKFYLQSGATMAVKRVREREWKLFQMLVAGGANLDDPAAAVLRDVVKLETAPYDPNVPGYISLK